MNTSKAPPTAAKAFVRARDTGRFCFERRRKDSKSYANMLALLGGKLDQRETPEAALLRELREEASIALATLKLLGQANEVVEKGDERVMRVTAYYLAIVAREADLQPTAEVEGLEWYTLDEALARIDLVPAFKAHIHTYREELER